VTDTPEDRRMIVLSSGILMGLNTIINSGGQTIPNSMFGEILEWKNAQKNEEKNRTSEEINRIIPTFNPLITCRE